MKLYDWQMESYTTLRRAMSLFDGVAFTAFTGFGKTVVVSKLAADANVPVVVVCPKSVVPAWERTLKECGAHVLCVTNYEKVIRWGKDHPFGHWAVKRRRWEWTLPEKVLVIFDEAHKLRNRTTQSAKLALASSRQRVSTLLLSATLFQDPTECYAIGRVLGLHSEHDWFSFLVLNQCEKEQFGFVYKGGKAGMEALHSRIFPDRGYTAKVDDIPNYPRNFVTADVVPVDDPATIDQVWEQLEEINRLRDGDQERAGDNDVNPLVETLRLRQAAEICKVPAIVDLVTEALTDHAPVVFVNFRASGDALHKAFPEFGYVHGDNKGTDRQDIIDQFKADILPGVICLTSAGGTGTDLNDVNGDRPRVSFLCPSWSAIELIQALGRCARANSKTPTHQQILVAAGTVEERIKYKVDRKVDNISALTDNDLRVW